MINSELNKDAKVSSVKDTAQLKTLKKSLNLMNFFTIDHPEWSISELSAQSGLYKSNVFNILHTLVICGYVEKNEDTGKYRLGKQFLYKSYIVQSILTKFGLIHRFVVEASQSVPEIIYFGILNNYNVMYIDVAIPENKFLKKSIIGMTAPAHCTGIGKALLAFCKPEIVDNLLKTKLVSFTENTITDPSVLNAELERIRQCGYSIDNSEHNNNEKCVAVPVFDRSGNLYGAISASGSAFGFTQDVIEKYAERLKYTARQIQYNL